MLHLPRERSIGVIDAGATSMGLLSPVGPPTWHGASDELKQTTNELRQHCKVGISLMQRLHHEFDMGGRYIRGMASQRHTPPTPNFCFSSDFGHLILRKVMLMFFF